VSAPSRVYGRAVTIDPDAVAGFFAIRARRAGSAEPLTSVLYQDAHPELAVARDRHEKSVMVPKLHLDADSRVLDVGCGIGRWAEPVLAAGAGYCGTDFSEPLLEVARDRVTDPRARFAHAAIQDLDPHLLGEPGGFDRVIVAGVLIYLNDEDVVRGLDAVTACAAPRSQVYLREPVATGERLTLNGHWSSDLDQSYSAVYRTAAELDQVMDATLGRAGFALHEAGELYPPALNNRADTRQRYFLWRRSRVSRE